MPNNDKLKTISKIILYLFILMCLVTSCKAHEDTKSNQQNQIQTQRQIQNINHKSKQYTTNKVLNKYGKSEPNISQAKIKSTKQLKQGLQLAFNHCQTTNKYNQNQAKIKQLLGNSLGNQVLANVHPYSGSISSTPLSLSDHIQNMSIAYGKYDLATKTMAVNILVKYKTPKNVNVLANEHRFKRKSFTYYSAFQISYQVKTNQYTIEHFESGQDSNQAYILTNQ